MKTNPITITLLILALSLAVGAPLAAQESPEADPEAQVQVDERSYRLAVRDLLIFRVQDEPDTEAERRIDGHGRVRLPYIGNVEIAGMTVRDAEDAIEEAYIDSRIYVSPQVSLRVLEYAPREVSVLGQVKDPGTVTFPIEVESQSIISVISEAGGLTGIARAREVRVTRRNEEGETEVHHVNVDQLLGGDGAGFQVYPGDVIYVPERFF